MKKFLRLIVVCLLVVGMIPSVYAQGAYDYLIEVAKTELANDNYEMALEYFEIAKGMAPAASEDAKLIQEHIDLIKNKDYSSIEKIETETAIRAETPRILTPNQTEKTFKGSTADISETKKTKVKKKPARLIKSEIKGRASFLKKSSKSFISSKDVGLPGEEFDFYIEPRFNGMTIDFDEEDIERFPLKVVVRPDLSFYIKSSTLKRFLAVSPESIVIERIAQDKLKVNAIGFGKSAIHVWTAKGRQTISAMVRKKFVKPDTNRGFIRSKGFRFEYDFNTSSYYKGRRFNDMEKRNGNARHTLKISGPISLGDFTMKMGWSHSAGETDLENVSASITDGSLWFLEDFSLYAFDISGSLSTLSSPGAGLRGYRFRTPIFKNFEYSIFWGKQRDSIYGSLSSGVTTSTIDSYLEGAKLTYKPGSGDSSYSFNIAKGYGSDRSDDLPDKAYSIETNNKFGNFNVKSELGSDESNNAGTFDIRHRTDKSMFSFNYKNIETEYQTVSGRAPGAGDISFNSNYDYKFSDRTSAGISVNGYRSREFYNPDKQHHFNHSTSTYLSKRLGEDTNVNARLSYSASPNSTYESKTRRWSLGFSDTVKMKLLPMDLFTYNVNYNGGKSTYGSTGSFTKTHGLSGGLRFPLTKNLSTYANYSYYWEISNDMDDYYSPRVCDVGLSYGRNITRKLSGNFRISYRNEENTVDGSNTGLSGSDSMEMGMGFNYRVNRNVSFYISGSARNNWAEREGVEKYTYANVRFGSKIAWDSFISFAPSTKIKGRVFLDKNGNGILDDGEGGIGDIAIVAGPNDVITNDDGTFETKVRAQKALVSVNVSTLPSGYVFTTVSAQEFRTDKKKEVEINFGLAPQSGIAGVVFYDINGNGKYDKADISVPRVRILLDGGKTVKTTSTTGYYYFPNATSGEHTLLLDLSSVPKEYLPATPLKASFEVIEGITYMHYFPLKKN